jgi:hypothetical protein
MAAMSAFLVGDGSNDGPATDVVDLDARLDSLHSAWSGDVPPLSAEIVMGSGTAEQRTLHIALGRFWSTVTYEVGLDSFLLWDSVGDATILPDDVAGDGDLMLSSTNGDFRWVDPASAITAGAARRAAREFFATGERPTCLAWRES